VRAYLDIESLRLGDRLKVEKAIDPGLLKVLIPPLSFQPLVENAVQHGLHSSPRAGRLTGSCPSRAFRQHLLEVRERIRLAVTALMLPEQRQRSDLKYRTRLMTQNAMVR
jgi:LytS/YehU family sensor histidine kinase